MYHSFAIGETGRRLGDRFREHLRNVEKDDYGGAFKGINQLTIGSWVSVRSSRYEARGKIGEHERCVRVARGVAESNSRFLSALQTSQVLHISMNAQLTHEPIVL